MYDKTSLSIIERAFCLIGRSDKTVFVCQPFHFNYFWIGGQAGVIPFYFNYLSTQTRFRVYKDDTYCEWCHFALCLVL